MSTGEHQASRCLIDGPCEDIGEVDVAISSAEDIKIDAKVHQYSYFLIPPKISMFCSTRCRIQIIGFRGRYGDPRGVSRFVGGPELQCSMTSCSKCPGTALR